jgi:ribonuclease HI
MAHRSDVTEAPLTPKRSSSEQAGERVKAIAICDGRGNAGTGARAAVLYLGDGLQRDRHERAEKIPATTNIVAEHLAIQLAMELAKDHRVTELVIYNDSRTPVNHVNGNFKVKQEHLIPIVAKTRQMGSDFVSIEIRWTRRENTKEADALCRAVDSPRVHGAEAAVHPRLTTSEHP